MISFKSKGMGLPCTASISPFSEVQVVWYLKEISSRRKKGGSERKGGKRKREAEIRGWGEEYERRQQPSGKSIVRNGF